MDEFPEEKIAFHAPNAHSEVYLSKEYFCKMCPTCVSSKLCEFILTGTRLWLYLSLLLPVPYPHPHACFIFIFIMFSNLKGTGLWPVYLEPRFSQSDSLKSWTVKYLKIANIQYLLWLLCENLVLNCKYPTFCSNKVLCVWRIASLCWTLLITKLSLGFGFSASASASVLKIYVYWHEWSFWDACLIRLFSSDTYCPPCHVFAYTYTRANFLWLFLNFSMEEVTRLSTQ